MVIEVVVMGIYIQAKLLRSTVLPSELEYFVGCLTGGESLCISDNIVVTVKKSSTLMLP